MPAGDLLCEEIATLLAMYGRLTAVELVPRLKEPVSPRAVRYALTTLVAADRVRVARRRKKDGPGRRYVVQPAPVPHADGQ